tara:strand:- start:206 stop:475 length:270 start_codon:yes stop_codon:yes gene_type:complete
MTKLHKPSPGRKQLLYFVKDQLQDEFFAIVRFTWFSADGAHQVTESPVYANDLEAVSEFPFIIKEALQAGADVSILSLVGSADLGIGEL